MDPPNAEYLYMAMAIVIVIVNRTSTVPGVFYRSYRRPHRPQLSGNGVLMIERCIGR